MTKKLHIFIDSRKIDQKFIHFKKIIENTITSCNDLKINLLFYVYNENLNIYKDYFFELSSKFKNIDIKNNQLIDTKSEINDFKNNNQFFYIINELYINHPDYDVFMIKNFQSSIKKLKKLDFSVINELPTNKIYLLYSKYNDFIYDMSLIQMPKKLIHSFNPTNLNYQKFKNNQSYFKAKKTSLFLYFYTINTFKSLFHLLRSLFISIMFLFKEIYHNPKNIFSPLRLIKIFCKNFIEQLEFFTTEISNGIFFESIFISFLYKIKPVQVMFKTYAIKSGIRENIIFIKNKDFKREGL